jgi:hypothetical protein
MEVSNSHNDFVVNKCINTCTHCECHINQSFSNLQQSRLLLSKFDRPKRDTNSVGKPNFSACYHCKKLIPFLNASECRHCSERYCLKHKMDHGCKKDENMEKYINAKNQFKLKLREIKNKAAR